MPTYTQSNTDPVSVNGMFLKFYLDVMLSMTETFKEGGNVKSFNLYAMFLRSCVPSKERRDEIDDEMEEVNQKMQEGYFGDIGKEQSDFIRGFCVVSASTKFLNDAFHITQSDSSALADMTDDDLLIQFEKYAMYKTVRNAFRKDKDKLKVFERRIADGSILNMKNLSEEILLPDEAIPQDDLTTQLDMGGDGADAGEESP